MSPAAAEGKTRSNSLKVEEVKFQVDVRRNFTMEPVT